MERFKFKFIPMHLCENVHLPTYVQDAQCWGKSLFLNLILGQWTLVHTNNIILTITWIYCPRNIILINISDECDSAFRTACWSHLVPENISVCCGGRIVLSINFKCLFSFSSQDLEHLNTNVGIACQAQNLGSWLCCSIEILNSI